MCVRKGPCSGRQPVVRKTWSVSLAFNLQASFAGTPWLRSMIQEYVSEGDG